MKRLSLVVLSLFSLVSFAQVDEAAKADLDKVINEIKAMPAFSLSFTYSLENKEAGVSEVFQGTGFVQGESYSIKVMGYHQICNPTGLYSVSEDDEEVIVTEESESGMSISGLLSLYESGMKIAYGDKKTVDGKEIQIIVLVPVQADSQPYHRVEMAIDKKSNKLVYAYQYGKNGTVTGYKITKLKEEAVKSPDYFNWKSYSEYEGFYVEDLR